MAIEQVKTFGDIIDAVITRGKLKEDTATRSLVKERVNTAMLLIAYAKPYRWCAATKKMVIKKRYTTGTALFTNNSSTVTGTSTVWDLTQSHTSHEGWKIYHVGDNTIYDVARVNSATELNIEPYYVGDTTETSDYVMFRSDYGLPPDCQDVRRIIIPNWRFPIRPVGPNKLDDYMALAPTRNGLPRCYTVNGLEYYSQKTWSQFLLKTDFFEDDPDVVEPRQKKLTLYPCNFTDNDVVATVRYTRTIPQIGDEDEEPIIPVENRYVIVLKALVENFLIERDFVTKREWQGELNKLLKQMEGDIETTDDELIMSVDRESNRWQPTYFDDEDYQDFLATPDLS